jgi:hypothetical protein
MKPRSATVLTTLATAFALVGCSRSIVGSDPALCTDVAGVHQLIADAQGGLSQADQLARIQSLESSVEGEAIAGGMNGNPAAGTAAARLSVALSNWKTEISLDENVGAAAANAAAAADDVPGCKGS